MWALASRVQVGLLAYRHARHLRQVACYTQVRETNTAGVVHSLCNRYVRKMTVDVARFGVWRTACMQNHIHHLTLSVIARSLAVFRSLACTERLALSMMQQRSDACTAPASFRCHLGTTHLVRLDTAPLLHIGAVYVKASPKFICSHVGRQLHFCRL